LKNGIPSRKKKVGICGNPVIATHIQLNKCISGIKTEAKMRALYANRRRCHISSWIVLIKESGEFGIT
jgi:hypothetical protein